MSSPVVNRSRSGTTSRRPAELSPHDIATFLKEALGARLVALTVDVDPKTVDRWVAEPGRTIQADNEERLRHAYQVFHTLQQVEAPATIRAWFMGMNPQLDDLSPAEAIRDGRHREAMSAARAFVTGG